jgi:hypothetical protein
MTTEVSSQRHNVMDQTGSTGLPAGFNEKDAYNFFCVDPVLLQRSAVTYVIVPTFHRSLLSLLSRSKCIGWWVSASSVIHSQQLTKLHPSTLMMVIVFTFETSAISPTATWCNNPRTELTSIINHRESIIVVIYKNSTEKYLEIHCMHHSLKSG